MNTVNGTFIEKTIPDTKDATINVKIGNSDSTMNLVDFQSAMAPIPAYKVYTALLTQSGGDNIMYLTRGEELTIGITYRIYSEGSSGWDLTNVGAPNNDVGTTFVATGTTPNSYGSGGDSEYVSYNTGAPVATVLENTIGNVWFTYGNVGNYNVNSDGLFIENKQYLLPYTYYNDNGTFEGVQLSYNNNSSIYIFSQLAGVGANDMLSKTPIEIRVYN